MERREKRGEGKKRGGEGRGEEVVTHRLRTEALVGGSGVQGQFQLHRELEATLNNVRPCLKKTNKS